MSIGRHSVGPSPLVDVLLLVLVVADQGAPLLDENGLNVVAVPKAEAGVAFGDVTFQVTAVAVVEEKSAGLGVKTKDFEPRLTLLFLISCFNINGNCRRQTTY